MVIFHSYVSLPDGISHKKTPSNSWHWHVSRAAQCRGARLTQDAPPKNHSCGNLNQALVADKSTWIPEKSTKFCPNIGATPWDFTNKPDCIMRMKWEYQWWYTYNQQYDSRLSERLKMRILIPSVTHKSTMVVFLLPYLNEDIKIRGILCSDKPSSNAGWQG